MIVVLSCLVASAVLFLWARTVLNRVNQSEKDTAAFVAALPTSVARRQEDLKRVRSAIAGVDRTVEQWSTRVETGGAELRALAERLAETARRDRRRQRIDGAPEQRAVKIVGGRVHRSYAIAGLKMTLDARGPASAPVERPPKDTLGLSWHHPVEFVVPTLGIRPKHSSSRSAVAVEDMLASEGVAQALVRGWPEAHVHTQSVDPGSEWSGYAGNICTFCRDSRNPATGVILSHPAVCARFRLGFPELDSEAEGAPKEAGILIGDGPPIRSPSYAQERAVKDGLDLLERAVLEDYALLARVTNPWDPDAKILVVAGIRAFGTLGAAELLRTRWEELYESTGDADFACLVSVQATYQVEFAEEPSIAFTPPDELEAEALELVPTEDVPTAVRIVRIESAA